ncbi:MAG: hypothetical protein JSS20_01265 [Proteobacteria bacterium]|nr:hypothetical protein [Pseudomonadota bacterium]
MKPPVKIDDRVSTGGHPSETDLAKLRAEGVHTVINLRRPGEPNQPLDPVAHGDAVKQAGLHYVPIPVDSKNLSEAEVDAVAQAVKASPGPVHIH